jgi:tRNA A37 N6-isopentenylltransferase MiaA
VSCCTPKDRTTHNAFFFTRTGIRRIEKAIENIKVNTRRLAKGQRTWFKTFKDVNWIDCQEETSPEEVLEKALTIGQFSNKIQ